MGPLITLKMRKERASDISALERGIELGRLSMKNNSQKNKTSKKKKNSKANSFNAADRFMHAGMSGRALSTLDPVKQYAIGMRNPFDPRVDGVRTPDIYSFPVTTGHVHGRFNMIGNSTNHSAVAILPNPIVSVIDVTRQVEAIATISSSSLTQFSNNLFINGATLPGNLDVKFNSQRLVCGGVKVRVAQVELTRTGTVIFAPFACLRGTPGVNALTGIPLLATDAAAGSLLGGASPASFDSAAVLSMPGAFEMSLADMGRKDVILPFRVLSPAAHVFKNTNIANTYNASESYGDSVVYGLTGTLNAGDLEEVAASDGWSGWIIYLDGFNDTANTDNILSCEYDYHLEGTPAQPNGGGLGAVLADSCLPPVIAVSSMSKIIETAATLPWAEIIPAGMSYFGIGSSAAGMAVGKAIRNLY
jgi:hypothetical protein